MRWTPALTTRVCGVSMVGSLDGRPRADPPWHGLANRTTRPSAFPIDFARAEAVETARIERHGTPNRGTFLTSLPPAGERDRHPPGKAMTTDDEHARTGQEAEAPSERARAAEPAPSDAPWLLRHRVELPDPIEGYIRRPEVEDRCALLDHRLTVLHAPGGFGKTVLLAHCCRALRARGPAVAWLTLDEEDGPESVATYLALAFERAGIETFDPAGGRGGDAPVEAPDPEADSQAEYRIHLLHGAPCVLALDEVERLQSPEAVVLLNALLRRAPRNLHVGMAFRERPPGLAIAMFALEGRGAAVTAEELRFSTPDISRFFGERLSRREFASVAADSAGWPLALHIYRNAAARSGAPNAAGGDDTVAGWIETRLWRGLSAADRDFVLDIALFDRLDDAAASADQELLREAAVRGGAGAVPGHPRRHRGGHGRRQAVARTGSRGATHGRRAAERGGTVETPAHGAGALRGAHLLGRYRRCEARLRRGGGRDRRLHPRPRGRRQPGAADRARLRPGPAAHVRLRPLRSRDHDGDRRRCCATGRRRRSRPSRTPSSTRGAPSGLRWRGSCRGCASRCCSPGTRSTKRSARGDSTACLSGRPSASTSGPRAGGRWRCWPAPGCGSSSLAASSTRATRWTRPTGR